MTSLLPRLFRWCALLTLTVAIGAHAEPTTPDAAFELKGVAFANPVTQVRPAIKTATAEYTALKDGRLAVFECRAVGGNLARNAESFAKVRLKVFDGKGARIKARMQVHRFDLDSAKMKRPALEAATVVQQDAKSRPVPQVLSLTIIAPIDATSQTVTVKSGARVLFTATLK